MYRRVIVYPIGGATNTQPLAPASHVHTALSIHSFELGSSLAGQNEFGANLLTVQDYSLKGKQLVHVEQLQGKHIRMHS